MAFPTHDEEVHHRKEEDALDQADLNNQPDVLNNKDGDKKIVASESAATSEEQEVKDANQEDESRGGMMIMIVPSTTTTRSLTQEEEEELREKEARAAAVLCSMFYDDVPPKDPSALEIDDSEQALRFLTRWKAPETPPKKIIHDSLIEQCSRPIQKQLTTSDVKEWSLSLPRKKFQQLLDETRVGRKEESRVSVYGPDGKVYEMWLVDDDDDDEERSSFELMLGWRKFVVDYELKECCDFITVWMFRHRGDTQRICLAVDAIRFSFRKEVSKRISDAAFEDSD